MYPNRTLPLAQIRFLHSPHLINRYRRYYTRACDFKIGQFNDNGITGGSISVHANAFDYVIGNTFTDLPDRNIHANNTSTAINEPNTTDTTTTVPMDIEMPGELPNPLAEVVSTARATGGAEVVASTQTTSNTPSPVFTEIIVSSAKDVTNTLVTFIVCNVPYGDMTIPRYFPPPRYTPLRVHENRTTPPSATAPFPPYAWFHVEHPILLNISHSRYGNSPLHAAIALPSTASNTASTVWPGFHLITNFTFGISPEMQDYIDMNKTNPYMVHFLREMYFYMRVVDDGFKAYKLGCAKVAASQITNRLEEVDEETAAVDTPTPTTAASRAETSISAPSPPPPLAPPLAPVVSRAVTSTIDRPRPPVSFMSETRLARFNGTNKTPEELEAEKMTNYTLLRGGEQQFNGYVKERVLFGKYVPKNISMPNFKQISEDDFAMQICVSCNTRSAKLYNCVSVNCPLKRHYAQDMVRDKTYLEESCHNTDSTIGCFCKKVNPDRILDVVLVCKNIACQITNHICPFYLLKDEDGIRGCTNKYVFAFQSNINLLSMMPSFDEHLLIHNDKCRGARAKNTGIRINEIDLESHPFPIDVLYETFHIKGISYRENNNRMFAETDKHVKNILTELMKLHVPPPSSSDDA